MRDTSAAVLLFSLLVLACDNDPGGRCTSARECLAGQVCTAGVCAAPGAAPPNQAPVAVPDAYGVPAGAMLSVDPASGVLANDADPDGDPLTTEKVTDPSHGVVFLRPDGSVIYVPATGFTGADTFTYRASDGALRSEVAAVTVNVGP